MLYIQTIAYVPLSFYEVKEEELYGKIQNIWHEYFILFTFM